MKKIKYIKSKDAEVKSEFDLMQIIKGVLLTTIITICILLLSAVVLTYTDISFSSVKLISSIVFYLGALLSGVIAGFGLRFNGWAHGVVAGGLYVCIILMINLFLNFNDLTASFPFVKVILSCVLGCMGGVLGVNIPRRKIKRG